MHPSLPLLVELLPGFGVEEEGAKISKKCAQAVEEGAQEAKVQ